MGGGRERDRERDRETERERERESVCVCLQSVERVLMSVRLLRHIYSASRWCAPATLQDLVTKTLIPEP